MFHIGYIENDPARQFAFEQIAVLLRARGFDNDLQIYPHLAQAFDQIPQDRPDVVFVDVHAQTEHRPAGLDLVRALRQHPLCQKTTIIGLADYAMPADRRAALAAGCNDFLPRPLRYQAVEDVILLHQVLLSPDMRLSG
jgi:CheY-like chemotaxis protein